MAPYAPIPLRVFVTAVRALISRFCSFGNFVAGMRTMRFVLREECLPRVIARTSIGPLAAGKRLPAQVPGLNVPGVDAGAKRSRLN